MDEIEEVKQRTDIVDLIGSYVQLKKAGANYKGVCPFHQEKTPSLMVSPQKQIWKCFGCGKGGDCFRFVMESEHLEFGDSLRLLASKAGVVLKPKTAAEHQTQNKKELLFRINELATRIFQKYLTEQKDGASAMSYLKGRKISDEIIKEFRLGFAPKNNRIKDLILSKGVLSADLSRAGNPDRFYNRIIFPITDVLGNVIGFTGRTLDNSEPKYLNTAETPIFNKSRAIYGLNRAKKAIIDKKYVILVEGQTDVLALHQAGITNAVASSGTAFTEIQLIILSKYTTNFLLAFDSDLAGKTATKKIIEQLIKNDLFGKVVDFSPYKDPGELFEKAPNQWEQKQSSAKSEIEWLVDEESKQIDLQFVENKKAVTKALLPILSLIVDPTRLDTAVLKLSDLLKVKSESIYSALEKNRPDRLKPARSTGQIKFQLTNEEQLLALVLNDPLSSEKFLDELKKVVWQSLDTSAIAKQIFLCYDDKALIKNQIQFQVEVKNRLDSSINEKINQWQFWLGSVWPDIKPELSSELITEKLRLLTTTKHEKNKERLASEIRQAQEKGDIALVKKLVAELTDILKED